MTPNDPKIILKLLKNYPKNFIKKIDLEKWKILTNFVQKFYQNGTGTMSKSLKINLKKENFSKKMTPNDPKIIPKLFKNYPKNFVKKFHP